MKLHTKILIGLAAGAAAGLLANALALDWLLKTLTFLDVYGRLFIRLITMIIIPLVAASLICGVASLGDIRKLGRIGGKTLGFFLITTVVAASIGIPVAALLKPGIGLGERPNVQTGNIGEVKNPTVADSILSIVPSNPVGAAASGDLLGVIVFTIVFGAALGVLPEDRRGPVLRFFAGVNDASMVVIGWAMKLAPTAVFCLIAAAVAKFGVGFLRGLAMFCVAVLIGLAIHLIGTYGIVLRFLCGANPFTFYRRVAEVPLMAFSTSSSSATLPVSLETAEKDLGISQAVAGFVLPLGATMNKTGSALYKTVAAMFIMQVLGVPAPLSRKLMLIFAATVSAMTTAGVPGSGMVSIVLVLQIAGLGYLAPAGVALVAGVDRILDMCRTAVNVTGNMVCVAYVARSEGEKLETRPVERVRSGVAS
ncbi:MAG: dicarboxylate/amino acid:cation symporter [Acidobacteriia bacterium]|nr:dicarboxylate/amino acid:cation symporter [Terriglobia bacterium]